jgi:hypothetical protein
MRDTPSQARSLWPLPGGAGRYLDSLRAILHMVDDATDTDEVLARMVVEFDKTTSLKAARSYLHVVADLRFIDLDGPVVRLTSPGRSYLKAGDPTIVRRALLARIAGAAEILELLGRRPMRIGLLHERMQEAGYSWTTVSQIRYRLRWLEEVGAITRHGAARPEYRSQEVG